MFRVYLKSQLKYDEMQRISPMRGKRVQKNYSRARQNVQIAPNSFHLPKHALLFVN